MKVSFKPIGYFNVYEQLYNFIKLHYMGFIKLGFYTINATNIKFKKL